MNAITGLIGIAMLLAYAGTLTWAISAWPFTIIVLFVLALTLYDFVRSLGQNGNGSSSP